MSRVRADAVCILEANMGSLTKMLLPGMADQDQTKDFDIYLMDKGVMPLLMQGLDALAKHVDRLAAASETEKSMRPPFNPLIWLAQFLLRNHPQYAADRSLEIYAKFKEIASVHKGRRFLMRKLPEIQKAWIADMGTSDGKAEGKPEDVHKLVNRLDQGWGLQGAFVKGMPHDFRTIFPQTVTWRQFKGWFQEFVPAHDVIRESTFLEAARRIADEQSEATRRAEEAEVRRRRQEESQAKRRDLDGHFASLSADMYMNDSISRILTKGAFIQGLEPTEGGPALYGDHVALILAMIGVWGCPVAREPGEEQDDMPDVWNDAALTAWSKWLEQRGLGGGPPRVDAVGLRCLLSKEQFTEYLKATYPLEEDEEDTAEALDEATGELIELRIDRRTAAEVREQLAAGEEVRAEVTDD